MEILDFFQMMVVGSVVRAPLTFVGPTSPCEKLALGNHIVEEHALAFQTPHWWSNALNEVFFGERRVVGGKLQF